MSLALSELRRTKSRFAAIAGAVGFIVFLALILSALGDGLYRGQTGVFRASGAPLYAFSDGSELQVSRSQLSETDADRLATIEGVSSIGALGATNLGAVTPDGSEVQMTLVGAGEAALPQKLIQGQWPQEGALEVVADSQMRRRGIELGSTISVTGGPELEVVGIASDAGYGFDTAWTSIGTWDEVRSQVRPELSAVNGSVQAFAVGVSGDAALVQARIADAGFDVGTVADAIAVIPGAEQQKTTLGAIVNTTFVVAAIVIGLFFALVTLEKRTQFAVLKAIGMSNRRLVGGIFAQALVASVVGFVAGLALSRLVGVLLPADVPALFLTSTAVSVFVTTIFTGALGAVISFRRVIKIDPATAIGGAA